MTLPGSIGSETETDTLRTESTGILPPGGTP